ncbi:general secretion pathway protein GspK [Pseudoalteromonas piscicida]|uniref:General secretion pathway protein K n=1 Tax=Pseudoalteromonas piscicida TaxID=43662 RepID=A0ABM6NJ29_PSEO7|nr:general secretion pathway protein GspK [Pseudoalteromonas piscicida]ATD08930.1 general secretion pathway protein K [Pseudoalteromonas piscicida]WPU30913.1 general secretion pathway protein GspK [Pseudoalteromonas piscicida]
MIKNNGIALIQVLVLTAILMIVAVFFSKTAKEQVNFSSQFQSLAKASVELHSVANLTLFNLLTFEKKPNDTYPANLLGYQETWNYHGAPFQASEYATVSLQDMRGLLNLNYPNQQRVLQILTSYGLSHYDAKLFYDTLVDYQSVEEGLQRRNGGAQYKHGALNSAFELANVTDDLKLIQFFEENSTVFKSSSFNPMTAPDALLMLLLPSQEFRGIKLLRDAKQLSSKAFSDITMIQENSGIILYPSNNYRISISVDINGTKVVKTYYYLLKPAKTNPVELVSVKIK